MDGCGCTGRQRSLKSSNFPDSHPTFPPVRDEPAADDVAVLAIRRTTAAKQASLQTEESSEAAMVLIKSLKAQVVAVSESTTDLVRQFAALKQEVSDLQTAKVSSTSLNGDVQAGGVTEMINIIVQEAIGTLRADLQKCEKEQEEKAVGLSKRISTLDLAAPEIGALGSRVSILEAKVEAVSSRVDDLSHEALPIHFNPATEESVKAAAPSVMKDAAQVQMQKLDDKNASSSQELTDLIGNVQPESFPGGETTMTPSVSSQVEAGVNDSVPSGCMQPLATECVTAKNVQSYRELQTSVSVLDTSVWDAMFLIGTDLITIRGQLILVCGLIINFLLQIGTVFIVSMHMIVNPYDEPVFDELRRWKKCENKAEQQLVPNSGCKDLHLDVQTMWTEVNSFFTADLPYPAGWVMSILATTMWVLVMAAEFRDILRMLKVVWCMPEGVCTRIMENNSNYAFVEVHVTRRWVMFFITIARFVIAVYLLHSGTMFLIFTSDIEALILNAVAFAFVIEVDAIIFGMLAPSSVIHLIGNLDALPVPDLVGQDIDVCILLLFVLAYIFVIDIFCLRPFVHSMEDVIKIINW